MPEHLEVFVGEIQCQSALLHVYIDHLFIGIGPVLLGKDTTSPVVLMMYLIAP